MEEGVISYETRFVITCETADSESQRHAPRILSRRSYLFHFFSAFVCLSTSSDSHCCAFWLLNNSVSVAG